MIFLSKVKQKYVVDCTLLQTKKLSQLSTLHLLIKVDLKSYHFLTK